MVVSEVEVKLKGISPGSRKLWEEHGLELPGDWFIQLCGDEGKLQICGRHTFIFGHAECVVWSIMGYLCGDGEEVGGCVSMEL